MIRVYVLYTIFSTWAVKNNVVCNMISYFDIDVWEPLLPRKVSRRGQSDPSISNQVHNNRPSTYHFWSMVPVGD